MNMELSIKKQKLKIKLFNECFLDMQKNIKLVLKKTSHVSYKVEYVRELFDFVNDMEENMKLFQEQNPELLKKVKLLDQFFKSKPSLSQQNKQTVWRYLETLYTISSGKNISTSKEKEPFDIQKMSGLLESIMKDENNGLKDLIGDISIKLQDSLKDKNINEGQLVQDLLSGKSDSSGINFSEIITQASSSLQEKVQSGDIDISKLKEIADDFKL